MQRGAAIKVSDPAAKTKFTNGEHVVGVGQSFLAPFFVDAPINNHFHPVLLHKQNVGASRMQLVDFALLIDPLAVGC